MRTAPAKARSGFAVEILLLWQHALSPNLNPEFGMPLPITAFYPERVESSDDVYAAVGRALTLATRLEANCRTLAIIIGARTTEGTLKKLKEGPQEDWGKLIRQLTGGNFSRQIDQIAKKLDLSGDFRDVLHEARDARNYISHEFTIGWDDSSRIPQMDYRFDDLLR